VGEFASQLSETRAIILGRYILQGAGCRLKYNYNWKTPDTKNN